MGSWCLLASVHSPEGLCAWWSAEPARLPRCFMILYLWLPVEKPPLCHVEEAVI